MQNLAAPLPPDVAQWNEFLSQFSIRHFDVGFQTREADAQHIESGQYVRLRFGADLGRTCVYDVLQEASTYTHLTSLAVHEFFWPRYRAYPEAPALATLRIILASCGDYSLRSYLRDSTSGGIFQATSATEWSLPGLRELSFTYRLSVRCASVTDACCCRERHAVSLSDVHCFVTSCLRYSADRLAAINLAGLDVIDVHPETWLGLLDLLAEDVSFSSSSPPTSADAPQRMWQDEFENIFRASLFDSESRV
ncbi:hypothetical protein AURDEDRAFT_120053 [Auricularia subglabra TFB-10046 SS5]|nr:hypothetical protein AURDEDRAFT_120053 [Auricularia subglabra TFB-10046 SS5]